MEEIGKVYDKFGSYYLRENDKIPSQTIGPFMDSLVPHAVILDAGCAGGRDAEVFAQRGFQVVGIDVSDVFIKAAKERVPQGKFLKADLRAIDFAPNSFDAVWAQAVLLHIPKVDIPRVLGNLHRLLKPGGKLHICVKDGEGEKIVTEVFPEVGEITRPYTFFRKDELEKYISDADFKIIESEFLSDALGRQETRWIKIWAEK